MLYNVLGYHVEIHKLKPQAKDVFEHERNGHIQIDTAHERSLIRAFALHCSVKSQQAHDVNITSPQRLCNVMTLHRR